MTYRINVLINQYSNSRRKRLKRIGIETVSTRYAGKKAT